MRIQERAAPACILQLRRHSCFYDSCLLHRYDACVWPILLDLSRHHCLIVGGGTVAARKAVALLDARAGYIAAVAPAFAQDFPAQIKRIADHYQSSHLSSVTMVFAATDDPAVNDRIVRDARERNILCNRVDASDELPGDFTTPAFWQDESVIVAVAAGSAALSAKIRDELRSQWRPAWTQMSKAMKILRPELKTRYDEPTRRRLFRLLAEDAAIATLERGGIDGLREYIRQHVQP